MKFSFPDTAEGDNARQVLQESFAFGTRGVIPARFIDDITLDVPSGLGTELDGDLVIGPSDAHQSGRFEHNFGGLRPESDCHGAVAVRAVEVTSGTHSGRVQLRDKTGAFTARATFDVHNMRFDLTWAYTTRGLRPARPPTSCEVHRRSRNRRSISPLTSTATP